MSPGSSTDSYPAFAHIGLRENPGKNLNQLTCPDRDSNPSHLVSRPDTLTIRRGYDAVIVVLRHSPLISTQGGTRGLLPAKGFFARLPMQHLGYHKICARWVPRQLSDQHKTQRMASALTFLMRYHTDGDAFLDQIVTGDETWVSHNTPETKRQSRQWHHPSSPKKPRKFKQTLSTQKVMATVFWDRFGSDEELNKTVNTWLNELAAEEYNTGILKLVNRYNKCLNFKVCHGSLYVVMWLADEPREFNLPTFPQRRITYVPEKLPGKYGVHSEEYLPIRTKVVPFSAVLATDADWALYTRTNPRNAKCEYLVLSQCVGDKTDDYDSQIADVFGWYHSQLNWLNDWACTEEDAPKTLALASVSEKADDYDWHVADVTCIWVVPFSAALATSAH
ncbi:hypothetical protein ANN_18235 [Periplaneta americana]|uniref:Uncharacterized protein n=1 Tax=Periplaneta americana TaxID=6978 RepID=A0ABQ8SP64_PERAM|nr:hypothetical protein ANN_18235 [Periplaneta americana]